MTEGGGNLEQAAEIAGRLIANIETVIKGKTDVVRLALVAILCEGHLLFEDVPGTGKSMLARAVARSVLAGSTGIQCTPDILPSDITGRRSSTRKTRSSSSVPARLRQRPARPTR